MDRAYENKYPTKTHCECDEPMFLDERAIGMGFRCFHCGANAENRIPRAKLKPLLRDNKKPLEVKELQDAIEQTS